MLDRANGTQFFKIDSVEKKKITNVIREVGWNGTWYAPLLLVANATSKWKYVPTKFIRHVYNTTFVSLSYTLQPFSAYVESFSPFLPLLFFFQLAFARFFKKRIIERIKLALGDSKNYIKVYDCRAEGSCYCMAPVYVSCALGSLFMEYKCVYMVLLYPAVAAASD